MKSESQPVSRPRRGRPPTPVPDGRDLESEVTVLTTWFNAHPAVKPGTISAAAGLHPQRLGTILRRERPASATILDAVYLALKPYGDLLK